MLENHESEEDGRHDEQVEEQQGAEHCSWGRDQPSRRLAERGRAQRGHEPQHYAHFKKQICS